MRRSGILVAVGLTLSGCKYFDRSAGEDRAPPGGDRLFPAAARKDRNRDRDPDDLPTASIPKSDPHWLDGPASRTGRGDLPPSTTGRRNDSPADSRTDSRPGQGILAGYATDEFGRKLRGVYIEVVPADRTASGAPTGVETGEDGSFQIEGLRPNQSYTLSAKTTREGVQLAGMVYTKPPNPRLLLKLKEGFTLPDAPPRGGSDGLDLGTLRRPNPVPLSGDDRETVPASGESGRSDGTWSPDGPSNPKHDALPDATPNRPELSTGGRTPDFRPPATNIPPPDRPAPTAPPPFEPGRSESRSVRTAPQFALVDTLGRPREFPTGRSGELVLMEFMTTTCLPCKKAVPALKDLQARYGARGLEVIGVTCDEVDTPQRRAVASSYERTQDLNYLLYVEPGSRPGRVMERFGVEYYPTMVLINSTGDVLWKGDPRNLAPLERAIEDNLGR